MERLEGRIQNSAWGDTTTLAALLGRAPTGEPQAELWMGSHDRGPSQIVGADAKGETLDQLIARDQQSVLGSEVSARFGQLPYLFKVLAIASPLSIQVHPTLEQARVGFERENQAGVAIDAPNRTYRDPNHKPEMVVALTRFEGLCGFRDLDATRELIAEMDVSRSDTDEVAEFVKRIGAEGPSAEVLAHTVAWLLSLEADSARRIVAALRKALEEMQTSPEFVGAANAIVRLAKSAPDDAGVAVGLLLNHVVLEPGEGFFMGAGNLHAYLHGVGVEVMANSDNVVRGGLTPKHVAIDELLQICSFEPEEAPLQACGSAIHTYVSPVEEFSLTRAELDGDSVVVDRSGPRIVLLTEGFATLATATDDDRVEQGAITFIGDDEGPLTLTGHGVAWIAGPG